MYQRRLLCLSVRWLPRAVITKTLNRLPEKHTHVEKFKACRQCGARYAGEHYGGSESGIVYTYRFYSAVNYSHIIASVSFGWSFSTTFDILQSK